MCGISIEKYPKWKKSNQFLPDGCFLIFNNSEMLQIDIKLNGASPMKLNSSTKAEPQKI